MKKIFILGSLNMDIVISSTYMPKNGETISGYDYMTNPGGKGANQACACGKLGGNVYMAGCVGSDGFGQELTTTLANNNVNVDCVRKCLNATSGVAIIIIVDHDNRIILAPNANQMVDYQDVDRLLAMATTGDIFLTQLEVPVDVVGYALKQAKILGMTTILNPAPANLAILLHLSNVDILIPNESEIAILAQKTASIPELCRELSVEYQIPTLIVTMGGDGHGLYQDGAWQVTPCKTVDVVDTTAAGDTFCGALAVMLASEHSLNAAMQFASLAATLVVTKKGAQQAIPTLVEVHEFAKH